MKKKKKLEKVNLKDGFTIIEVVLVLAIAGLIFLMVFIALPALQRSQRDTQRRDDIARANTAMAQFMANNRNNVPGFTDAAAIGGGVPTSDVSRTWGDCTIGGATGFCGNYLMVGGDSFEDPDGTPYLFQHAGFFALAAGGTFTDGPNIVTTSYENGGTSAIPIGDFEEQNHTVWVTYNSKCDGERVVRSTGQRKVSLQYKLEGGGVVCVNN